jgi:hypothetical protein
MTQRIAIETPNGTVYLGEECEFRVEGVWYEKTFDTLRYHADEWMLTNEKLGSWVPLDRIRPIQPKKMRPMNKSELVQLILKGAEFHYVDGRGSSIFPMIQDRALIPLTLNGWNLTKYSHYTLPGDPTERKLEVEE